MPFDYSRPVDSLDPIQIRGRGPDDPDGEKANAILNAYINAQQVHVFRRLLWRRFAIVGVIAWALEAFTPVLPAIGLVVVVLVLGAGAVGVFVWERRTQDTLQALLDATRSNRRH